MSGEAGKLLLSSNGDNNDNGLQQFKQLGSEVSDLEQSAYLSPLQKSLVYELTIRRARIASAHSRADFWHKWQDLQRKDRFQADVLDNSFLEDLIKTRRQELTRLREAKQLKEAIVQA